MCVVEIILAPFPIHSDLDTGEDLPVLGQPAPVPFADGGVDICERTDTEGNYVFSNIRYGEETTFKVQPTEPTRQFEPAFKAITLNRGNPVQNEVSFNDISAYTVAGVVRFQGTQCFAPNVEIRVDGNFRGATDKNGKFAVPVDFGTRTIEAVYLDHTFDPPSVTRLINSDVAGLEFVNTTIRTISGRVGGGCDHFIGDVAIEFRSENGCLTVKDTTGRSYNMELPPQKYLVRVTDVQNIGIGDRTPLCRLVPHDPQIGEA